MLLLIGLKTSAISLKSGVNDFTDSGYMWSKYYIVEFMLIKGL